MLNESRASDLWFLKSAKGVLTVVSIVMVSLLSDVSHLSPTLATKVRVYSQNAFYPLSLSVRLELQCPWGVITSLDNFIGS
ncbi:unnamed protein product [Brassica rapa subsp. narinosa]